MPVAPVYIWLVAGSFQGKSLMASSLAASLGIPHVINTDLIRNILRSNYVHPPSWLGTSTYLLSPADLQRQWVAVSAVLEDTVRIYRERGESAILEGMHVSLDLLQRESQSDNTLVIGLDNQMDYRKRICRKVEETRLRGRKVNYLEYSSRVEEIHNILIDAVRTVGGEVVEFAQLYEAAHRIAQKAIDILPFVHRGPN